MSREAMKLALEALEILTDGYDGTEVGVEIEAITALRQALETEKQWVGLTDEEVQMFIDARWSDGVNFTHFIRAIEAKLKEKNT